MVEKRSVGAALLRHCPPRRALGCLLVLMSAALNALEPARMDTAAAEPKALTWGGLQPTRSTTTGIGPLLPLDFVQPMLDGVDVGPDTPIRFGHAVALHGDWLLVGAPEWRGGNGPIHGAVFFYQRVSPGQWVYRQRLLFGSGGDARCGWSVSLHGRHAVIGCPGHTGGGLSFRGRTVIYELNTTTGVWGYTIQSLLGDGADQYCGYSVAIHGTGEVNSTWAVSACRGDDGSVDVFQLVQTLDGGETWLRIQTLVNPEPPTGMANGTFGQSVAISRLASGVVRVAIGDQSHNHGGTASNDGIAYLFRRPAAGGAFTQEVSRTHPSGPQPGNRCGFSVALGLDDWFVGCPGAGGDGRVLAFVFNGMQWNAGSEITAPAGLAQVGSLFGRSVATSRSGTTGDLWVGQPWADVFGPGLRGGRVHRFQRVGGPPLPQPPIYVPVGHWDADTWGFVNEHVELGTSVAVDNASGTAVVGAPRAAIPEHWGEVMVFGPDRIFANGMGCRTGFPGC